MLGELLESGPHPATLDEHELLKGCEVGKGRTGGPGGQHRNKVETFVVITHRGTGIAGRAGERRSAEENRKVALRRLRLALAVGVRTPVPAGEVRSELWRTRCCAGKIVCNPRHRDYPALLAEALDVISASGLDPKKASIRLECSASQLIKLVKEHHQAFEAWNAARAARGLHALR